MELKKTIRQTILYVFEQEKIPLTPEEIYSQIFEQGLYNFNTDQPIHVIKTRLRRDCAGLDFITHGSKKKYFQLLSDGKYWLKGKPIPKGSEQKKIETTSKLNKAFKTKYQNYSTQFKENLLAQLNSLSPIQFEIFCKKFISEYGFKDVQNTLPTRDGGIDGYGNLTIGFTDLEVAFECKRWAKNKVGYQIIRSFRGCIPQSCVYGILFTTSEFDKSAKNEAERSGLKPIVLMDGEDIIEFMIKNEFGVEIEKEFPMNMYVNQIDLILSEDDYSN